MCNLYVSGKIFNLPCYIEKIHVSSTGCYASIKILENKNGGKATFDAGQVKKC